MTTTDNFHACCSSYFILVCAAKSSALVIGLGSISLPTLADIRPVQGFRGQGSCKVGGVGGEDDHGEEVENTDKEPEEEQEWRAPPSQQSPPRERDWTEVGPLLHQGPDGVEDSVANVPLHGTIG